jgi:hypothetical protein
MRIIYKIKALIRLWRDPRLEYAADYEVLVRLARRCAYDFAHASSFIPEKTYFMSRAEWEDAAGYWVSLFAKGNPGKDYRMKRDAERDAWRAAAEEAAQVLRENSIELPPKLSAQYNLFTPF